MGFNEDHLKPWRSWVRGKAGAGSDFQPQLIPCHTVGRFLERKPCEVIFEITTDADGFTRAGFILFAQFFDLFVVVVEECMCVDVVREAANHAADTAVTLQVVKEHGDVFAVERFFRNGGAYRAGFIAVDVFENAAQFGISPLGEGSCIGHGNRG